MFLEDKIKQCQRRIKAIEENPSPVHMRCNKLRYELELEEYLGVLEAWKEGKPFALMPSPLCQALGFEHLGYIGYGDRATEPQKNLDVAIAGGFPEQVCDRTITALGLMLGGELPYPKLVAPIRFACDPERFSYMSAALHTGALYYGISNGLGPNEDSLNYLTEQFGELIELAEKHVPGIKYSEDKLVELLELDKEAHKCFAETYALRKSVPCAISPQDSFRLAPRPSFSHNPTKMLEYCRAYRDELFERAEKGIGGVPEEKLRLCWMATGPFHGGTFKLLERKGVSIPWFHYGAGVIGYGVIPNATEDDHFYGRKLTPLEENAAWWNHNCWGGLADLWVEPLIQICRDLNIDAVVDFLQTGCISTNAIRKITSERVKEELGIPVIDLEGREHYMTSAARQELDARLEEFIDICLREKREVKVA